MKKYFRKIKGFALVGILILIGSAFLFLLFLNLEKYTEFQTAVIENITNEKQAYVLRDDDHFPLKQGDILIKNDVIITKECTIVIRFDNGISKTIFENSTFVLE